MIPLRRTAVSGKLLGTLDLQMKGDERHRVEDTCGTFLGRMSPIASLEALKEVRRVKIAH